MAESQRPDNSKSLWKSVSNELANNAFSREMKRDLNESIEYYLTKEQKVRLRSMGRIKQSFHLIWWLLKILFLRLSPARRFLFLVGVILLLMDNQGTRSSIKIMGGLVIIWLLLVELKDKLFAKDELAEGFAVQSALMPPSSPQVDGWSIFLYTVPANDVGGDMVDFLALDNQHFSIALGDVSGKGLSAALYMAKLQSTLRALASETTDLSEFGRRINRIFCRDIEANRFASMILFQLQPQSGHLKWLNAGHLPPLLIRHSEVRELDKGGPALGLSKQMEFFGQEAVLQSGEYVVAYSDGVTECCNDQGDFYGEDRLVHTIRCLPPNLAPETLGRHILKDVHAFRGNAPLHDDVSLAIVKRT